MGYTLKVEHPNFPPGTEFAIDGLGLVKNGSTIDIDDEQAAQFETQRGVSLQDAFGNKDGVISLSSTAQVTPPPANPPQEGGEY